MKVIALDAKPPKQAPPGRRCKVCRTSLSVYNHSDYCGAHKPEPDWVYQGYLFALCSGCGEVVQISRKTMTEEHYCLDCHKERRGA